MFAPRKEMTEQPCPVCAHKLEIIRDCHTVKLYCPACKKYFPLKDFIRKMDSTMETFLENVYMDRI